MPNPISGAKAEFRDPKVIWDAAYNQWVMALAEGNSIGFYNSSNPNTPDLRTEYWLESFDGETFTISRVLPHWIHDGPDFYATVIWSDFCLGRNAVFASRYAIGWMNNWDYNNDLPYHRGWAGQQSLVRETETKTIGGATRIVNSPISGYANTFGTNSAVNAKSITTNPAKLALPSMSGGSYMIRTIISRKSSDTGNEVRIRIKRGELFSTTIGFNFAQSQVFLVRDHDGSATNSMGSSPRTAYDTIRTSTVPMIGNNVTLAIYVDWNSAEISLNRIASMSG